ncbi:MAG: MFS transporter [Verrucomicrobiae bacterium]|nr:MFS transporter [Verrucomicrobiae bacterium]
MSWLNKIKIPGLRWWIVALLFLGSVNNYLDRQTLSVLAPTIQKELSISDKEYGTIANLFLVAYGMAFLVSGRVADRLGTRLSLLIFVTWWSLAGILTATARSAVSLGFWRFMLGLGEAGHYTTSPKVVSEWFPPKERGIAVAIYSVGATVGGTIAPVLIVMLNQHWGWQATFLIIGLSGFLVVVPWYLIFHHPSKSPFVTERERQMILSATASAPRDAEQAGAKPSEWRLWREVLGRREIWLLLAARACTAPVWFFYLFWFPKYLYSERHLSQAELAVTWIIYLAADIGTLGGGFLSGLLVKRGMHAPSARMRVMLGCACVMPLSMLVPLMPSASWVVFVSALVILADLAWVVNAGTMVVDLIPGRLVATAFGVVATGSTIGAMLMNEVVKHLASAGRYHTWFVIMGLIHPLVWLLLWSAKVHQRKS